MGGEFRGLTKNREMKLLPAVLSSLAAAGCKNDAIAALDAADACAANLGAAGNAVNKLANLRNLLNRAAFDCDGLAFTQSNDCDCVENAAKFVQDATDGSKAKLSLRSIDLQIDLLNVSKRHTVQTSLYSTRPIKELLILPEINQLILKILAQLIIRDLVSTVMALMG